MNLVSNDSNFFHFVSYVKRNANSYRGSRRIPVTVYLYIKQFIQSFTHAGMCKDEISQECIR